MPHIMVMHTLSDALETQDLANTLQHGFGQLDTVTPAALKTYLLPIEAAAVGAKPDNMIHIILRLKPGRTNAIKMMLCTWLHDTTRAYMKERGIDTTLSVEPLEMDYDFYQSSHA